jgi:hypothetical protein
MGTSGNSTDNLGDVAPVSADGTPIAFDSATGEVIEPKPGPYAQVGIKLVERGHSAVPIAPGKKHPGMVVRGEWAPMSEWTRFADRLPTKYELQAWANTAAERNLGISRKGIKDFGDCGGAGRGCAAINLAIAARGCNDDEAFCWLHDRIYGELRRANGQGRPRRQQHRALRMVRLSSIVTRRERSSTMHTSHPCFPALNSTTTRHSNHPTT